MSNRLLNRSLPWVATVIELGAMTMVSIKNSLYNVWEFGQINCSGSKVFYLPMVRGYE